MNTRTRFLHTATSATLLAGLLAFSGSHAATETMSVAATAPQQATLMPTVSVTADASMPEGTLRWRVADTAPTRVTLMPAVRVTRSADALAEATLPTVHVVAQTPSIDRDADATPDAKVESLAQHSVEGDDEARMPFPRMRGLLIIPR